MTSNVLKWKKLFSCNLETNRNAALLEEMKKIPARKLSRVSGAKRKIDAWNNACSGLTDAVSRKRGNERLRRYLARHARRR